MAQPFPNPDRLLASLPRLAGQRVCIVGDAMLDHYVQGDVERISPEAPVPVVAVRKEWHLLGGAGNVARNLVNLGGRPLLVSFAGRGERAQRLGAMLAEEGVEARLIPTPDRETTLKTRVIAQHQQVARIDREDPRPATAEETRTVLEALAPCMAEFPVVVISDYGKGLVTAELLDGLRALLDGVRPRPLVLVDPKVKNFGLYRGVDLLTPNAKEAFEGAGLHRESQPEAIVQAGQAIFRRLECRNLLITLGAQGMALFQGPDQVQAISTTAQHVFDVTGAGDTVMAALALALASGMPLLDACCLANYAAGVVVGEVGAACATPDQIAHAIRAWPSPQLTHWLGKGA